MCVPSKNLVTSENDFRLSEAVTIQMKEILIKMLAQSICSSSDFLERLIICVRWGRMTNMKLKIKSTHSCFTLRLTIEMHPIQIQTPIRQASQLQQKQDLL